MAKPCPGAAPKANPKQGPGEYLLPSPSARIKVGRAVPSAPSWAAAIRNDETPSDLRGALRTARPTSKSARQESPLTAQPLRYWRRINWLASASLKVSACAFQLSVVFGKRTPTVPTRTASANGPA
jgi:hypothetical protein